MQLITRYWQTINIISVLLYPFNLIYCALVSIRRVLYRVGLFNSYQASMPVIASILRIPAATDSSLSILKRPIPPVLPM